jgi:protein ImuA
MRNVARQQRLADLRARIAVLEKRPLLPEGAALLGGKGEQDAARGGDRKELAALLGAPAGLLHEIHAEGQRDSGAAFGFALGLACQLLTPARPAILFLQLVHEGQEIGLPYGVGLKSFGIDPARLVLGRLATLTELLWAVEEAIACRAVAAVVVEVAGAPRGLDFTASRRLSLRAASGGASVFLLRYGQEREASAARLRWRVAPAASQAFPFDGTAPGEARWRVVLEKGRLEEGLAETAEFLVDWTKHGFAPATAAGEGAGPRRAHSRPSPYGSASPALGDRLPQTG